MGSEMCIRDRKYLGRTLSFHDPHRTELENRIAAAWRKFYTLKSELTSKRYSLSDRLRLFHGTITPTMLYAAETWTLTAELENRLRRTQRQMLRMILHAPRRKQNTPTLSRHTQQLTTHSNATFHSPQENGSNTSDNDSASTTSHQVTIPPPNENDDDLEPWAEWIKRCTRLVENQMKRLNLEDWVTLQRRRKWRWARKLATKSEFNWETAALHWDPTICLLYTSPSPRDGLLSRMPSSA